MNCSTEREICFGTLALGANYRKLACQLAKDIQKYSPNIPLVVLTDKPQSFKDLSNVLAYKHHQQSIGCYHDKRCVLTKALEMFTTCIFIDADMRIYGPLPDNLTWPPGISAHTIWHNITKHNKNETQIALLRRMADKLTLDLTDVSFVHECLFVVSKDGGKEQEFLKIWAEISPFFELNGYYAGEGSTIGLAAKKANLETRQDDRLREFPLFKDKFVLSALSRGIDVPEILVKFLEEQKKIEYKKRKLWEAFIQKPRKFIQRNSIRLRLIIKTLRDYNFYYQYISQERREIYR
jgi:hypothetical protein